ncbi:class I SAM-dependent methyltransferase [Streptomyces sp. HNM0575]|nr:class I SAM-dependent methyltransferase [Streptomyces sp. HNM0575]NLU71698.1 class I SAM-dependent methyltransferase [Streptomyces sp. HNM0575]
MEEQINARLALRRGDRIADIGAGTGLFLRRLLEYATEETPLVCVDPSQPMLDRLPDDPRLLAVRATAEDLAHAAEAPAGQDGSGKADSGRDGPGRDGSRQGSLGSFDAIVIKEAVHHFADLHGTLAGLARRLAPGGRMLVVTLPPKLEYPLFQRALNRFAANQPEPGEIETAMRDAGLEVATGHAAFPVRVERDHWLELVRNRWMSVLSTFSDAELADGLAEIADTAGAGPGGLLEFPDRFAFIEGRAPEGGR